MKLLIFGDICPTSDYRELFNRGEELFCNVADLLRSSDYAVCNLECPATDSVNKTIKTGPSLKAEKKDIKTLAKLGFKAISIANNHILDYGYKGVIDTLESAEESGMAVFGGGRNLDDAAKPFFAEIGGKKIGFLSFAEHEFNIATRNTPGANLFDPYISLKQIKNAAELCDFLVVLYHGGIEHYKYPSELLQKKCRSMVDFGANLVVCQHSHCIGTYELYSGATIVYGQGNSVFGYSKGDDAWNEGLIIELDLDDNYSIQYHLIKAAEKGISINENSDRLAEFHKDSAMLADKKFLVDSFSAFCKKRASLDLPLFFGKSRIFIKLNRILKGKLFNPSKRVAMITHNLIRCDAWNEVLQEDLDSIYRSKSM